MVKKKIVEKKVENIKVEKQSEKKTCACCSGHSFWLVALLVIISIAVGFFAHMIITYMSYGIDDNTHDKAVTYMSYGIDDNTHDKAVNYINEKMKSNNTNLEVTSLTKVQCIKAVVNVSDATGSRNYDSYFTGDMEHFFPYMLEV